MALLGKPPLSFCFCHDLAYLPKIEKKNTCNQKYHQMNIKVSWVKIDTKVGLLLTNKYGENCLFTEAF